MDIRAILLVSVLNDDAGATETVGGIPIAYLDVLGLPVIERVLRRLRQFGVCKTTLISDLPAGSADFARRVLIQHDRQQVEAEGAALWESAEETFSQYAAEGADLIIALRLGPWGEVDFEEMIQHHLDHHCVVSMAVDAEGASLDLFVLNPSSRFDARELFQSHLQRLRRQCAPFSVKGYFNRLETTADLRRLALHGLLARNGVRPEGTEIKPGVFVGPGARIHRKARVIAPAFVGAPAKVRASALITRGTVIEHHGDVDCGTVVENSSVLPFTRVGAGLDVMHAVVGFRRLAHLRQNVEVEIADEKFVGMVPLTPLSRLAGSTAALFAFIPMQIYRGLTASSQRTSAAECPESLEAGTHRSGRTGRGGPGDRRGGFRVPLPLSSREEIWRQVVGP